MANILRMIFGDDGDQSDGELRLAAATTTTPETETTTTPSNDEDLDDTMSIVSDVIDFPIPVPEGFPRGPNLTLTDADLGN